MEFFSADTHAFHCNIIKYCDRPFETSLSMTKYIAEQINSIIIPNDTYYHLGDWSFGGIKKAIQFREMINCKKVILIYGNHDRENRKKDEFNKLFEKTSDLLYVNIRKIKIEIFLCHYAMLTWPKSHYNAYHLFGHSHGNLIHPSPKAFDVGVDSWDFKPLSILEIKKIFKNKLNKITIKKVNFISKREAEHIIPSNSEAIISISDPAETVNLSNNWNYKLELKFHDIDRPVNNYIQFNKSHYKKLMDFLKKIENEAEHVTVHCHAGICRSAAVAKFIADIYKIQFNHQYQLYNKFIYSFCHKLSYINGKN